MYYNVFLIAMGVLCILYTIFGLSLGWGFYFGLKVITVSGIFLMIHGILRSYNNAYIYSTMGRLMNLGIIITFTAVMIFESFILSGAYVNDTKDVDYILVLGAGIIDDRPSLELRYRLDTAIDFFNEHPNTKKLVLCGGKGKDEKFSEAYVMEKYLTNHGLNKDMLLKEEKSRTTYENIRYAKDVIKIVDSRENIKVAISSNDFHIFRSKLIARRLGFEVAGLPSKTPLYIIPNHHVREYFAIVKSLLTRY